MRHLSLLLALGLLAAGPVSAYTPDGQVPTSLAPHMPATWDLSTLKTRLWVDANATSDGDGSAASPFKSIQSAVDAAQPGTVILVKAGKYFENVTIDWKSAANGTDTAPIFIVSADGLHAATVKSEGNVSTFGAYGRSNWAIIGFKVVGSAAKVDGKGDDAPIKIGGKQTDPERAGYNWFMAGNLITGQGHDGSKSYSVRNVYWIGNTYENLSIGEEVNDNVTVGVRDTETTDNQFGFNTIKPSVIAQSTNMTLKMGSNHYKIFNNEFGGEWKGGGGAGMRFGGTGNIDKFPYPDEPQFFPPTISYCVLAYNRFNGRYGKNVQMVAPQYSKVLHNDLANPNTGSEITDIDVDLKPDANGNPRHYFPFHNEVAYNKITSETENDFRMKGKNPYTNSIYYTGPEYEYSIHDNSAAQPFDYTVGSAAVAPLLEKLIAQVQQ